MRDKIVKKNGMVVNLSGFTALCIMYIRMYSYAYVRVRTRVRMRMYVSIRVRTLTYVYVRVRIEASVGTRTRTYAYVRVAYVIRSEPPPLATVDIIFVMIFGRTDLRISLSRAKFDEEVDFEVRSAVALQNPHQISEKPKF